MYYLLEAQLEGIAEISNPHSALQNVVLGRSVPKSQMMRMLEAMAQFGKCRSVPRSLFPYLYG
jgi:hypothetical protein